jgi:dTDP-4-dehydrorhamnose reductase
MATATLMPNKKKIFITGANGLLGQKLVEQLVEKQEFEVVASGKGDCRLTGSGFAYLSLDLTNPADVFQLLGEIKPDVIIHAAAMTNVDVCELNQEACYEVNVTATQTLVRAGELFKSHFIYISTDFIFSGDSGPLDESALPSPVNFYGKTKLEAEQYVMNHASNWAIARTVLVYGIANDLSRSNIILWVKSSLEQGKKIQVVDDQYRTPTLAEDLAAGCVLLAEQSARGIFHLSGADYLTPYQMALLTAEYFGLDKELIQRVDSSTFSQPAVRPLKTGFIIEKAQKELGFQPKTFLQGIAILANQFNLARH